MCSPFMIQNDKWDTMGIQWYPSLAWDYVTLKNLSNCLAFLLFIMGLTYGTKKMIQLGYSPNVIKMTITQHVLLDYDLTGYSNE